MVDSINVTLAIGLPLLGGLVWLIRLEGRVNTHSAMQEKLSHDVEYIRARIDDFLNGHHK